MHADNMKSPKNGNSRYEYSQSLTVNQLAIIFLSKMSPRWSYGMYEEGGSRNS